MSIGSVATLLPTLETMTASLATDGSQGTFFGASSSVDALGGAAGYYVGSWLILNRTPVETWLTLVDPGQRRAAWVSGFDAAPS